MPLIQWDSSYNLNIGEVDRQHQKLVALINELNDAMRQRKSKEIMSKTLDALVEYATSHFRMEERYFDQYGYPETVAHKKEHTDFSQQVLRFKKDFEAGNVGLSVEVMTFLSRWLTGHILGSDRKYAPFLHGKGVK